MAANETAIEVIACLVEVVADDDGRIDLKCFERIFNACVKSLLVGARVGDQAVALLKSIAGQVAFPFPFDDFVFRTNSFPACDKFSVSIRSTGNPPRKSWQLSRTPYFQSRIMHFLW